MEGHLERIFYCLGFPRLAINIDLQTRSLARPVVVNKHVMGGIHRHTILGSHFNGGIRPTRCEPYDEAKIPLVPARVRDVAKAELIAGPMLSGVFFLKNLATLQSVEIHPQAESTRLAHVEITGLAEVDLRFTTEFCGLAGRPILIDDFPSHKLSIVTRKVVRQVAVEPIVRHQSPAWRLR